MNDIIAIYATNEDIEHLNMMARIHSIKNKYDSPPINQISKPKNMNNTLKCGIFPDALYVEPETKEECDARIKAENHRKKHFATCAKNRRNRKSKKRKNR